MKMKNIAILGGTFDPIHNAHLELAHVLVHTLHFDKVLFIPCKQNPLKSNVHASEQERIQMISLAIAPFSEYQCDTREIDSDSSFTITMNTLKSLRQDYPNDSLTFVIGVDAFNQFDQWHYFESFLDYVHLVIFPRPNYNLNLKTSVQTLVNRATTSYIEDLHQYSHGYFYFSNEPNNAVSSTDIRELLKTKNDSKLVNCLPQSVLTYIQKRKLYTHL